MPPPRPTPDGIGDFVTQIRQALASEFGEHDADLAFRLEAAFPFGSIDGLREHLPDIETAPGSTGSSAGDDARALELRDSSFATMAHLERLDTDVEAMISDVPPMASRDIAWLLITHLGYGIYPSCVPQGTVASARGLFKAHALATIFVAGTYPHVLRGCGYNPAALSIGAHWLATSGSFDWDTPAGASLSRLERLTLLASPLTRQFLIAVAEREAWTREDLVLAEREGPHGAPRSASIHHWNGLLVERLVRAAFQDVDARDSDISRAALKRRANHLTRDGSMDALHSLWAAMHADPTTPRQVWRLGRNGKFCIDGLAVMDAIGVHSPKRPTDVVIEADMSPANEAHESREPAASMSAEESASIREAWDIVYAAAADDLDRRDLELVRSGSQSRRERARAVGLSEGALRKREIKVLWRLKGHPEVAAALKQLFAA
jgi:hypothetical protein